MAKVSVCVVTYGDYLELLERCLGSIIQFFPREQYRLLVGTNAVSPRVAQYLDDLKKSGAIDTLILSEVNINKCPMMRRLFEQIETEFIWWFDDDSWVNGPDTFAHWLKAAQTAPPSTAMWGHVFYYSNVTNFSRDDMVQWVRDAPLVYGNGAALVEGRRQRRDGIPGDARAAMAAGTFPPAYSGWRARAPWIVSIGRIADWSKRRMTSCSRKPYGNRAGRSATCTRSE